MALSPTEIKENPWVNDREWVKCYNVRFPKDRFPVEINGVHFTITPGVAMHLPKAVIGVLKDAVHEIAEPGAIGPDPVTGIIPPRKTTPFNRFEVVPCTPPTALDEEYKKPEGRPKNIVKETRLQNELKTQTDNFIKDVLPEAADAAAG